MSMLSNTIQFDESEVPATVLDLEIGNLLNDDESDYDDCDLAGLEDFVEDEDYKAMLDLTARSKRLADLSKYIDSTHDISRPIMQQVWDSALNVPGIEEFDFDLHPNTYGLESAPLSETIKEKSKEIAKAVGRKAVEIGKKAAQATGRFLAKRFAKIKRAIKQDEKLASELLTAMRVMSTKNKVVTDYFNGMSGSEKVSIKLSIDKKIDKIVGSYAKKEMSKGIVEATYGAKPSFIGTFNKLIEGLDMEKNGLKKISAVKHDKLTSDAAVEYLTELHQVLEPINKTISELYGKVSDDLVVSKSSFQTDRIKKDYVIYITAPAGLESILNGVRLDSFEALNKTEDFMEGISEIKKTEEVADALSEALNDVRAHADLVVKSYGLQMDCLRQIKHSFGLLDALTRLRIKGIKSFIADDAERSKEFSDKLGA